MMRGQNGLFGARFLRSKAAAVRRGGEIFGARSDKRGPIGGGPGYRNIPIPGRFRVSTVAQLRDALESAKVGDTIFIETCSAIDCTELVYTEKLVLEISGGVTLAGDRGRRGSAGAMIFSDTFSTNPLFRAMGPNVRITGLRIRGPDPKRRLEHHARSFDPARGDSRIQHEYYYRFPISSGIEAAHDGLEVDNCEIAGWSLGAIHLKNSGKHLVHHCFIHHNQYNGLGYGICLDKAAVRATQNAFNYNRHSIAGTGAPGTLYEASDNIEMGVSLSHCFDMHGGRDREDGTDIAGDRILIHHNTFRAPTIPVVIRGVPRECAMIHHNWFVRHPPGCKAQPVIADGNLKLGVNCGGRRGKLFP